MSEYNLKHYHSHLNTAAQILELFDGSIPFAYFIKNHFSQNKKFGSKDRKQISRLCYAFFRLGKSFPGLNTKERILTGLKNCSDPIEPQWQQVFSDYNLPETPPKNIFPWKSELGETIDATAFEASFATQPILFLRIRPGHEKNVSRKLENAGLPFSIDKNTVALPNSAKADGILLLNKEVVVQDFSSQKTGLLLDEVKNNFPAGYTISVYDCCAASGGKSIMAFDLLQNIQLTVSDIRPAIIANLQKRFKEAGISNYDSFVGDISAKNFNYKEQYDLVIADVPCTGSGTWARTPDQLYYFTDTKIDKYVSLQNSIIQNAVKVVKPGGFLLYITCSVFKKENEEQVQNITRRGVSLLKQQVIKGYENKADSMFAALLCKTT